MEQQWVPPNASNDPVRHRNKTSRKKKTRLFTFAVGGVHSEYEWQKLGREREKIYSIKKTVIISANVKNWSVELPNLGESKI